MKHFQPYEIVDRITFEHMGDQALSLFNPEALQALDDLREYFGVPITVNNWHSGGLFEWRGFRTPEKAIELGAPQSRHAKGEAFDLDVQGMPAEEVRRIIIENKNHLLLQRITRLEAGKSWVHFDVMELPQGVHRIHLFKA
jgi:hypothetical protein